MNTKKSEDVNYIFHNPGYVKVRKRVDEQSDIIRTDSNVWYWEDCGRKGEINWDSLPITNEFKEILKGYLFHRIQSRSLSTIITHDRAFINFISTITTKENFPWTKETVVYIMTEAVGKERNISIAFRKFYDWCVKMNINGFTKTILSSLKEEKISLFQPYKNIFLNPIYLTVEDENSILKYLDTEINNIDYITQRNQSILQLVFELGPRSSQIHSIEQTDLKIEISSLDENQAFYSIELSMAKKIGNLTIEKRGRKITARLGRKLERLIDRTNKDFNSRNNKAVFINPDSKSRLSSKEISDIVVLQLNSLNLSKNLTITSLRHHLAQSLADQGASAEVIAEILGHNSTLPARAYIASTPEIAKIKTKALGKNSTYANINKMLMTGKIIEKKNSPRERWVNGMVGSQYIGGIGSCGLSENTACPKNPVYSCYTCNKFHPFKDGPHEEVKTGLQKQAQLFIDIAEKSMTLEHNRPVIQLERTIESVNEVITRINNPNHE